MNTDTTNDFSKLLSISIVVFEPNLDKLKKTIQHLFIAAKNLNDDNSIVVQIINNSHSQASADQITALFSEFNHPPLHITYIGAEKNLGYGSANNLSLLKSKAKYHLVLNPDAYLAPDCLTIAIDYLENNKNCVLLSPAVYYENGERQYLCRKNITFFSQFLRALAPQFIKKLFKNYLDKIEYLDHDYSQPIHDVPFLTGCFMLLRTKPTQEIGGFDERYFLYVEDADLTRRLLTVGNTIYYPKAKITHSWARMAYKNRKCQWYAIASALKYCWKFKFSK